MPILTPKFYRKSGRSPTDIYVETGSYKGNGIARLLDGGAPYSHIHTIELAKQWYDHCTLRFNDNGRITIHHGNSTDVLPKLIGDGDLAETPITFFLDGHYSGKPEQWGNEETPLLHELDIIAARNVAGDIVIIDDCRMLGRRGESGRAGNEYYPPMTFDWTHITLEHIRQRLPRMEYLSNGEGTITDGPRDQLVFYTGGMRCPLLRLLDVLCKRIRRVVW